MPLYEVLAANREDVLVRWQRVVRGTLAPEAIRPVELIDHIPQYVDEIVAALRMDAGLPVTDLTPEQSKTAEGHGVQRLRLGFSLDSVVREYGALRDAIIASAMAAGAEILFRELQVLFDTIVTGIAGAVSEYAHQRDAELIRHTNEHFAFIAHELRNPLSSARLGLMLLKEKGQLPTPSRSVDAVEQGIKRAVELIDETLQVARVASGIELRRQWTTLKALFQEVELGAISEAESRDVKICQHVGNDDRITLDVRLVSSALGNLLRNAVKYTRPGSEVALRGRVTNGRLMLEVEDCCGGLPPGKVEEVFAPFVRLDSRPGGFGLGLAIAKQAADAHGGSIRVQNLPGKGCIFVLELPMTI